MIVLQLVFVNRGYKVWHRPEDKGRPRHAEEGCEDFEALTAVGSMALRSLEHLQSQHELLLQAGRTGITPRRGPSLGETGS